MAADDLNVKVKFVVDSSSFDEINRFISSNKIKIPVTTGGTSSSSGGGGTTSRREPMSNEEVQRLKKIQENAAEVATSKIDRTSRQTITNSIGGLRAELARLSVDKSAASLTGQGTSDISAKQLGIKEAIARAQQLKATQNYTENLGFLDRMTKAYRKSITGVLIDLHMLRVIGQQSKVVSSMFEILAKSLGFVVDMALLPMLPIIVDLGIAIRNIGLAFRKLPEGIQKVIAGIILFGGGLVLLMNTIYSVVTAYSSLKLAIFGETVAHKALAATIWTSLLPAFIALAAVIGSILIFNKAYEYGKKVERKVTAQYGTDTTLTKRHPEWATGKSEIFKGFLGLASGGPLSPGQTAIVGEKGPELLVPSGGGFNVIPNRGLRFLAEGTEDEGIFGTLLKSIEGVAAWLGTTFTGAFTGIMDMVGGIVGSVFQTSISGMGVEGGVGTTVRDSEKAILSKGFATQNTISYSGFKNANTLLAAILAALMGALKGEGGLPEVTPAPVDASSIWELIGIPILQKAADIWNLVTSVADVLSHELWNLVLKPVTYVSDQLWKLVEPVVELIPWPWKLGSPSTTNVPWPWTLVEPAIKLIAWPYTVGAPVVKALLWPYVVTDPTNTKLQWPWTVVEPVVKLLKWPYTVGEPTETTLEFPWTLVIPALEIIAFPWKLGSPATTDVSFPWKLEEPTPDPVLSTSLWILQKVLETVNSDSLWNLVITPQSILTSQIWNITLPTTKEVISALDLATVETPAAPKTFQVSDLWQLLVTPQQFFSEQIWQVILSAPLPITTDMIVDLRHIDPDEIADDWLDAFKEKKPQFNLAGEPGSDAIIIIEKKKFWGDAMEVPVPYAVSADVLFPITPVPKTSEDLYPVTNVVKTTDDLISITPVSKAADILFPLVSVSTAADILFPLIPVPKTSEELYPQTSVTKTSDQLYTITSVAVLATTLYPITSVTKLATDLFGITSVSKTSEEIFPLTPSPKTSDQIFPLQSVVKTVKDFFSWSPTPTVSETGGGGVFERGNAIPILGLAGAGAIVTYALHQLLGASGSGSIISLPAAGQQLLGMAGSGAYIVTRFLDLIGQAGGNTIINWSGNAVPMVGLTNSVVGWGGVPVPAVSETPGTGIIYMVKKAFWGDIMASPVTKSIWGEILTNYGPVSLLGGILTGNFPIALIGGIISLTGFVEAVKQGVQAGVAGGQSSINQQDYNTYGGGSYGTYGGGSTYQYQQIGRATTTQGNIGAGTSLYWNPSTSSWYAYSTSENAFVPYTGQVTQTGSPQPESYFSNVGGGNITNNPVGSQYGTPSSPPSGYTSNGTGTLGGYTFPVYQRSDGSWFAYNTTTGGYDRYTGTVTGSGGGGSGSGGSGGGGSGGGGSGGDGDTYSSTWGGGYNWLGFEGGKYYGMKRSDSGDDLGVIEITKPAFDNAIQAVYNIPVWNNKTGVGATNINERPDEIIFPYQYRETSGAGQFFLRAKREGVLIDEWFKFYNNMLYYTPRPYSNMTQVYAGMSTTNYNKLKGGTASERLPGLFSGGSILKSGLAWVGERGPELTFLPKGAEVMPTRPSLEYLRGGGESKPTVIDKSTHIHIEGNEFKVAGKDERQLFEEFLRLMERESRSVR